jgi:hypothetical protein
MRKYTLASSSAKTVVDLTDYTEVITEAVHEVMPKASVIVEKDGYYVNPDPSKGDAIRIGRAICKSDLAQHCVQISKLFNSIPTKEDKHDERKQQLTGGHH